MMQRTLRSRRAFTLVEAMVVLAIFGMVTASASMVFVAMLQSAKRGRGALQAMGGTRATLDFMMDEGRAVGGADLPNTARVLIDKSGGQRNTDVLWMLRQNSGYSVCAITGVSGNTLRFSTVRNNGTTRCCFEAGAPEPDTPPVSGGVPAGPAFRRTAVVSDLRERFMPVFLSGSPSATNCQLTMTELPGIDRVINAGLNNRPDLSTGAKAVLTDVKRFYVDYDAESVRPPFGAMYVQVELDGDVTSFADERQRLSSNTLDFRAAVGYGNRQPNVIPPDDDEDDAFSDDDAEDADADFPDIPEGNNPFLERAGDRAGWRNAPVPVVVGGEAAPLMLGLALQTGVGGDQPPPALPWSTEPLSPKPLVQVMTLTGRVMFRSEDTP